MALVLGESGEGVRGRGSFTTGWGRAQRGEMRSVVGLGGGDVV